MQYSTLCRAKPWRCPPGVDASPRDATEHCRGLGLASEANPSACPGSAPHGFSKAPAGRDDSVSAQVARILGVIEQSGVNCQLTPMGTILKSEGPAVVAVVRRCFETLAADCPRIGVPIKIGCRAGPAGRLQAKTARIEEQLGRKLRT